MLHKVTFSRQTVLCAAFGQFLCSDTEVGPRDVALFNVFETNTRKRSGTEEREDGGAGRSSEIHVGSNCSIDAEESDRFRPAGVRYCHLTATV